MRYIILATKLQVNNTTSSLAMKKASMEQKRKAYNWTILYMQVVLDI